jgi:hypothetical protein
MRIEKRGRYFAVMDGDSLVCICLYRKGAAEVIKRLTDDISTTKINLPT